MDDIFVSLLLLSLVTSFISVVGFIIRWIMKKPKKKWGIVALAAFVLFWVIGIVWGMLSCNHEWIEESRTNPTYDLPGFVTYRCSLCDETKTDKIDSLKSDTEHQVANEDIVGNAIDDIMLEIKAETDPFVEKLISFGFTENEAVENAKILKQCGIPTIDICEPASNESIDNLVVFRGVMDDNRTIWFTVENRKIFYVSLNGEDLYDEDKGGYLKNFNEVHIPETSVSVTVADELRNKTESVLDNYFASTRYYDAWAYGREDNQYMVQCQATDGSVLTSNWISCRVWFEQQSNGEFIVTGVQINGVQYEVK